MAGSASSLIDAHGRRIDYVRLSVTDRCNLRCSYCMAEDMTFLPRRDLLTLEEIAARVHTIAQLHRLLTQSSANIDGPAYLADVCAFATETAVASGNVRFATTFERGLKLPEHHLGALGMILVEGVINASKYAHPSGIAGRVSVGGRTEANGDIILEVNDDGVGLPDEFCPSAHGGVGMRMMQGLASQIPADLSFRSTPLGLTVQLRLGALNGV